MRRGEVWWVDFAGGVGGEIRKKRPAVIVSSDASNRFLNRLQVVPLTSKLQKLYPGEAYVTLSGRQQKAMADQLTTVSRQRVEQLMGELSRADLAGVENAIRTQLDLGA